MALQMMIVPAETLKRNCHPVHGSWAWQFEQEGITYPKGIRTQGTQCYHCTHCLRQNFLFLGLANNTFNAIPNEQGYNTIRSQVLSCLDWKGIDQLLSTICNPGGMKDGSWNPKVNVPFCLQELIMCSCFSLKHQNHCSLDFRPSIITLDDIKELCLQWQIEETHNNKVAQLKCLRWDTRICEVIIDLINEHFPQIHGANRAPCTYIMWKGHFWPTSCLQSG